MTRRCRRPKRPVSPYRRQRQTLSSPKVLQRLPRQRQRHRRRRPRTALRLHLLRLLRRLRRRLRTIALQLRDQSRQAVKHTRQKSAVVQAANDEAKPNWRWRSGLSDGSSLRTRRQQLGTTTTSKL